MRPKTNGKGAKKARREAVGPSASAESTQPKVRQQQEMFLPVPLQTKCNRGNPSRRGYHAMLTDVFSPCLVKVVDKFFRYTDD